MEFQDVVERRRMVRNFADRAVDARAIERMLENALHAPSAGFSQGWAFLVLDTPADTARFWDTEWPPPREGGRTDITKAPVVIVCLSHKQAYLDRYAEPDKGWTDRDEARWPVPYWHIDTGMAALLMLQTAVDEDLGALFFGLQRLDEFREAFGVPDAYTPIGAVAVGHRAPDVPSPSLRRGRRGIEQVVHRGRW